MLWPMTTSIKQEKVPPKSRTASLFRNGRNQAVRIPREFELPGSQVLLKKEGGRLLIEPIPESPSLLEVLANLKPIKDDFPDVDANLPTLEKIEL